VCTDGVRGVMRWKWYELNRGAVRVRLLTAPHKGEAKKKTKTKSEEKERGQRSACSASAFVLFCAFVFPFLFFCFCVFLIWSDVLLFLCVASWCVDYAQILRSVSHEPVHSALPSFVTPRHETLFSWLFISATSVPSCMSQP